MKKAKPIQWNLYSQHNDYQVIDYGEIDIDEVLWNMEAALNYTYCMAPLDGGSAKVDLYQFGANANWYYGEGLGRWTQLGSTDLGWDAAKLFSNVINYGWPMSSSILAKKGFFTDLTFRIIDNFEITNNFINENDTLPGDNILDYRIFYKSIPTGVQQIDKVLFYKPYDEMNFYLQNLEQIKLELDAQYALIGKTLKLLIVIGEKNPQNSPNPIEIYHKLYFHYGIHHNVAE